MTLRILNADQYPIDGAMLSADSLKSLVHTLLAGDIKQQQFHPPLHSWSKLANHSIQSGLASA